MRYAAVSSTTRWLLLVDLQSKRVQPLENQRPEYYGISWFPDGYNLVLSHSGLDNESLVDIASYAQSEQGWLSSGGQSSRAFLSAPHQIICAPDGRIVCANTGRNVVTVFGFSQPSTFQEGGISSLRWDRLTLDQRAGDHLNSVYLKGNLLYVIAHGHDNGSKLATFDYPTLELISVEPLGNKTSLHNIWITAEGQRISCHSPSGSLIDLDAQAPLWESGSPIYTRGLAASTDYVLVGESEISGRDIRRSSLSGLWILDRRTWHAVDYLCLGPYGAVNEVRLLDVPDEAHHNRPFLGLPSILKQDTQLLRAAERLSTASAASRNRILWASYSSIFGAPEILPDGAKRTSLNQLSLVIKKTADDLPLRFQYTLDDKPGAHVSAVIGYQGDGGDKSMAAILLQPSMSSASLSVWLHDAQEWTRLPRHEVGNLPLSGVIQLSVTASHASLRIDEQEVIEFASHVIGVSRCDQGLGIRWTGCSVRPLEPEE